jgi:hypothetical protein
MSLVGLPAWAQTASYTFDSNLEDSSNSFDAVGIGSVSFAVENTRKFVRLGEDGKITLPAGVSSAIATADSFELSMVFRIPSPDSVSDCCWPIVFLGIDPSQPGFYFQFNHFPGFTPEESYLVYRMRDGGSSFDEAYLTNSADAKLGEWRRLSVRFELTKGFYLITLGEDTIRRDLPDGFDVISFRASLMANPIVLNGLENYDPAINPNIEADEMTVFAPAPSVNAGLNSAFIALRKDLDGSQPLNEPQRAAQAKVILTQIYLADYASVKSELMAYTSLFESLREPMHVDGVSRAFDELSDHEKVMQTAQSYVFETQYVPGNLDSVAGLSFEHGEVAPGAVAPGTPRVASAKVELNGSYHRDIAYELTDQSRVVRPTGHYLAAGDIVTIRVPAPVAAKGLSVIVGHHFRNMTYRELTVTNRYEDISVEYPLDATEIKLANPFGGGIYLKVPEGSDAGWFEMTIENAVHSPYFSWRQGRQTSVAEWLAAVASSGAPWADFESDKFMFTVPASEIAGIDNPNEIMARWDDIMDAVSLAGGKPMERPRSEYYTVDTRLVTPAYGAGYPMVIPRFEAYRGHPEEGWDPLAVMTYKPAFIMLHEMGHNQLHPTMGYGGQLDQCHFLEAEVVVHMLATSVYSNIYGLSLDEAFRQSAYQELGFDQAAFDWIITDTFRNNIRMYLDDAAPLEETEQLRYQHRGHAKYAEIARLFGWEGLSAVNAKFYIADQEQVSNVCEWRPFVVGRDDYIRAASEALGVNMTPLFHFWGINPSPELAQEMQKYPVSKKIYQQLLYYRENVAPKTFADYKIYHDQFPTSDYQYPRYEQYITEFDSEFAAEIDAQFEFLIGTYFGGVIFPVFADGFE